MKFRYVIKSVTENESEFNTRVYTRSDCAMGILNIPKVVMDVMKIPKKGIIRVTLQNLSKVKK